MKNFLIKLISDNNSINEKNVAGYIGLVLAIIYIILDIFQPINETVLNTILIFVGSCFGISAFEKLGNKRGIK